MKKKITKTESGYAIEIEESVLDLLGISPEDEVNVKTDGEKLIIEKETTDLPPTPDEADPTETPSYVTGTGDTEEEFIPDSRGQFEKELNYYWTMAIEDKMVEKFMGTVRPFLRAKLGYDFSELRCEQEAKKLALQYYKAQEKGEKWEGPYIPTM